MQYFHTVLRERMLYFSSHFLIGSFLHFSLTHLIKTSIPPSLVQPLETTLNHLTSERSLSKAISTVDRFLLPQRYDVLITCLPLLPHFQAAMLLARCRHMNYTYMDLIFYSPTSFLYIRFSYASTTFTVTTKSAAWPYIQITLVSQYKSPSTVRHF